MDITALAAALMVALGLLGADAVMHSDNVIVEVVAPPRGETVFMDADTLEMIFVNQLRAIADTQSLVSPPEIRASRKQGIGMALAEAAHVQGVAYALQTELGIDPDRLRLALFVQNGAVRALISGGGNAHPTFERILEPKENESLPDFVRRAAAIGCAQLAPYTTALYLMQQDSETKNFDAVTRIVDRSMAALPPTPTNHQRSMFQNITGIVKLFQDDSKAAKAAFVAATRSDPANAAAILNLAFAEIEINEYQSAAERMERLIQYAPPSNTVLLATAYMTWAAAEMGRHDPARADALLAKALQLYPTSSTGYDLWAESKDLEGDHAGAAALRHKAMEATADAFENYAEVAALYFHLSWQDDQTVKRSKFAGSPAPATH